MEQEMRNLSAMALGTWLWGVVADQPDGRGNDGAGNPRGGSGRRYPRIVEDTHDLTRP